MSDCRLDPVFPVIQGGSRSETEQIGKLFFDDISFAAQILVTLQTSMLKVIIKRFAGGLFEKTLEMSLAVSGQRSGFTERTFQDRKILQPGKDLLHGGFLIKDGIG